jgi:outer membrane protein insertion porin family
LKEKLGQSFWGRWILLICVPAFIAGTLQIAGAQTTDTTSQPAAATAAVPAAPTAPAKEKKLISPPSAANATTARGPVVKEIEVIYGGPKSVSKSVILANMRTTVGQPYSAAGVEEDVRNLYATGFFTNLRIQDEPLADGVKVIVIVVPKAIIKEIVVNGAKQIKEKRVRKETKAKVGDYLSEQQISTDADKIKEYYQNKGYDRVTVSYKIDVNEEFGRAVVTYNIKEGERAYVTDVEFVGNSVLTTKELRKQMKTRKKNFFSWINKSGLYKDDQFKEDLKKLRDYYQSKGYIDMEVKDVQMKYPEKDKMTVIITVFEGIQYHVGKISIEGNTIFTRDQIYAKFNMKDGSIYSPQGLEGDRKAGTDLYGQKGYIDTKFTPERQANVESGKMDLLFTIQEGPQSYVEKIVIQGNNKTKDKVIRRELTLAPGEVYNTVLADAAKQRLENLGYFNKVDVSPQDTAVPNRKNMVVTVEEKRTGSVTFGVGFSSVDSLLGFVELSQGNFDIQNFPYFTGAGQKFRTRVQYGLQRKDFTVSFTEPWFLDQRLSLGFDLFAREASYLSAQYHQRNYGGAVRLSRALNQFWTASIKYQLEEIEIYDFSDTASSTLRQEGGNRTKSAVTFGLTYDTRDSVMLTRRGEKVEFTTEVAGGPLLGQTDIYKIQVSAQKFFPLPYDMIIMLGGATGTGDKYDDMQRIPIFDRYFVGGARSVRGFDNRDVGPKDENGEPIGGATFGYANLELTYPIIDRVRGAVFIDTGFDDVDPYDWGDVPNNLYVGAGVGLRLNLPIGPLRLDFGVPLKHDAWTGGSGKFAFDVGYQF